VTTPEIRHDLFVYDTDGRFAAQVEQYLVAGIESDELVMMVASAPKLAILRDALGSDAELVSFVDSSEMYTRPETTLAAFDVAVRSSLELSEQGVRVYGEIPTCATTAEWKAWLTYEAIVNRVFVDHRVKVMCGYDARTVPEAIVRQAWKSHRVVLAETWQISPDYEEPETLVRSLAPAFEPLHGLRSLEIGEPQELHDRLAAELATASVSGSRARDLLVAAREVLSNAERYGKGVTAVRIGQVGGHVVCEVTDAGFGFDDPLAGYVPPRPLSGDRAGLWIARQLTSRLELRSEPDGLTVRLWG
jgi:anti-sigma regulatory factor (Ser/Thr protein kinase)